MNRTPSCLAALKQLSKALDSLSAGKVAESDGGVKSPVEKEYWKG